MKFHEKLRRRVAQLGLNKAKAARDAGLPESTISNYLVKEESLPRIDIAMKIAKAVAVPLEWLADDAADWPPPVLGGSSTASQLSDRDLMFEVGKRHRLAEIRLLDALDAAEKTDWSAVRREDYGRVAPVVAAIFFSMHALNLYSAYNAARENHSTMPGAERDKGDFEVGTIVPRIADIYANKGFSEVVGDVLSAIPSRDLASIEHDLAWAGARVQKISTPGNDIEPPKKQAIPKTENRRK